MNEAELYAANQAAGEEALVSVGGALRAMELFDASNETVRRQIDRLVLLVTQHAERGGPVMVLQNAGDNFFVDHELLRLDFRGLERLTRLRDLLARLDLNEIELQVGVTTEELTGFLTDLLAAGQGDSEAHDRLHQGAHGRVLARRTHGIARKGRSTESRVTNAVRLYVTLELFISQLLHQARVPVLVAA